MNNYSSIYRFAHKLLFIVPELINTPLLKSNGFIQFVQTGDVIENNIEILWPFISEEKGVVALISKIESGLKDDKSQIGKEVFLLVNEIANLYLSLLDNNDKKRISIEMNKGETVNKIISYLAHLKAYSYQDTNCRFTNSEKNVISRIQNKCSIVFQQIDLGYDLKKTLFLGDVTSDIYDDKIHRSGKLKEKYRIVKISHHGTKAHFTHFLRQSEKMIISNGGNSRNCITAQYALKYLYSEFICTNNENCEIKCTCLSGCELIKKVICSKSKEKKHYCGLASDYIDISV